jgi:hypothetical protein
LSNSWGDPHPLVNHDIFLRTPKDDSGAFDVGVSTYTGVPTDLSIPHDPGVSVHTGVLGYLSLTAYVSLVSDDSLFRNFGVTKDPCVILNSGLVLYNTRDPYLCLVKDVKVGAVDGVSLGIDFEGTFHRGVTVLP